MEARIKLEENKFLQKLLKKVLFLRTLSASRYPNEC